MTTLLSARDLALTAARGTVYGPLNISLDAPFGVVTGSRGSGKTCLLLTAAGRMKPTNGEITVRGARGPRALRAQSAIAGFDGIDTLEEAVTVGDAVTERARWNAPWYARVRRADDVAVVRALAPAFGTLPVPAAKTMIWDLDEDTKLMLRIGLALMDAPSVLIVDGVDHVHDLRAQAAVLTRLGELAASGIGVLVSAAAFEPALYAGVGVAVTEIPVRPAPVDTTTAETTPTRSLQEELV
ncbi:AAA family ATPase [Mycetocola tolaasinivorans]|uniref:AAA family ATPase n=1 Tax=Mycetocola tolaasinivorans TaxID=76635 RepID=A0A3L7A5N7_9MICO|nr:ATP-binding cassette domain-containing protein [Mycetocola tolaasinivorans]RLP75355.1 AAA family ATPase [Mycetocola tolaasinivorans]